MKKPFDTILKMILKVHQYSFNNSILNTKTEKTIQHAIYFFKKYPIYNNNVEMLSQIIKVWDYIGTGRFYGICVPYVKHEYYKKRYSQHFKGTLTYTYPIKIHNKILSYKTVSIFIILSIRIDFRSTQMIIHRWLIINGHQYKITKLKSILEKINKKEPILPTFLKFQ